MAVFLNDIERLRRNIGGYKEDSLKNRKPIQTNKELMHYFAGHVMETIACENTIFVSYHAFLYEQYDTCLLSNKNISEHLDISVLKLLLLVSHVLFMHS